MTSDTIALVASIATCLSALATFLTVREVAKQRRASYHPVLASSRQHIKCQINPMLNCMLPILWVNQHNQESNNNKTFISLQNVGLGTAKSVTVSWSYPFDTFIKEVNNIAQSIPISASFSFECEQLDFQSEGLGNFRIFWKNERFVTLDYILPVFTHPYPVRLKLPSAYIRIVSAFLYLSAKTNISELTKEIPNLAARFDYLDIGEKKHQVKIEIRFNLISLAKSGEFAEFYLDVKKCA